MFGLYEPMAQAYNEDFFVQSCIFFLLSDTVRDKQQRARKKKGEEEVRETRLVVAALTVYAGLP